MAVAAARRSHRETLRKHEERTRLHSYIALRRSSGPPSATPPCAPLHRNSYTPSGPAESTARRRARPACDACGHDAQVASRCADVALRCSEKLSLVTVRPRLPLIAVQLVVGQLLAVDAVGLELARRSLRLQGVSSRSCMQCNEAQRRRLPAIKEHDTRSLAQVDPFVRALRAAKGGHGGLAHGRGA